MVEHSTNFAYWTEIVAAGAIVFTGWYARKSGETNATNAYMEKIHPMSVEEIEHRMTICRQAILMEITAILKAEAEATRKMVTNLDKEIEMRVEKQFLQCQEKHCK